MNGTMIQFFHWYTPGDSFLWKHVNESVSYLADLGITAVWLPPAYKAISGGYGVGYGPYDLFDLGDFDQKGSVPTKYGNKDEYLDAIKALKSHNMQVIVDIVLNHKAGGDELETFQVVQVDQNNRNKVISDVMEIESYTKFTFSGRQKKYSDFEWNFTCFTGVDYAEGKDPGIYRIINDYGDNWDDVVNDEKGNYDFLMYDDIEHRNPFVRKELNYWGKWYHDQTGFDGVRLDAVKHISPDFYKEWLNNLRTNVGENIFAVGEYWAPGFLKLLEAYIDSTDGCMSLFDSSLQNNLHTASKNPDYDLREIFTETLVGSRPDKAVTVVDNHDTQPLQALEAPVATWFKPIAYALILLRNDGYPCVFYPDLYGASYKDHGKDGKEYEIVLEKVDAIEALLKARKDYAYGEQQDYFDDAHCIGWVRKGDKEHGGCAVVLSNKDKNHKSMEMGKIYAGKTFFDFTGHLQDKIVADKNGRADFPCPAGNVSVWVAE